MLDFLIRDIDEDVLDRIMIDSFNWLVAEFGDNSVKLNNLNFSERRKPFSKKRQIIFKWSYSRNELRLKKGYLAVMHWDHNELHVHCNREFSLATILELLFHEFCHSQQSGLLYSYYRKAYKMGYYEHPMEREANEFADKIVPKYWQENSWKFENNSVVL